MNSKKQLAVSRMLAAKYATNEKGCWLWPGSVGKDGYGFIRIEDENTGKARVYAVYRLSFEHFKGAIYFRQRIRHSCDIRRCYRPEHLLPGTAKQNAQDTILAKRAPWQKEKATKEPLPERAPMINPLAAHVLENEIVRTSSKGKRRQRKMDKMFAAFAKKHAMPWTRADRLKLTADLESEEEYKPYEL